MYDLRHICDILFSLCNHYYCLLLCSGKGENGRSTVIPLFWTAIRLLLWFCADLKMLWHQCSAAHCNLYIDFCKLLSLLVCLSWPSKKPKMTGRFCSFSRVNQHNFVGFRRLAHAGHCVWLYHSQTGHVTDITHT